MNAAIPLLPVYVFVVWTGTTLMSQFFMLKFHLFEGLFVSGVSWWIFIGLRVLMEAIQSYLIGYWSTSRRMMILNHPCICSTKV
jgi:hypothetical protein